MNSNEEESIIKISPPKNNKSSSIKNTNKIKINPIIGYAIGHFLANFFLGTPKL